jgi:hypothetical protein
MHGTEPPRCFAHRSPRFRQPGPEDDAAGRACTATTLAGQRCRHWALQGTDPPRCFIHAYPAAHGRLSHGYFRRTPFRAEAMAGVTMGYEPGGANDPLALEIAVARFKVAGLLAYLEQPALPPAAFLRAARLLIRALRTTARLLRSQLLLSDRTLFPDADLPTPEHEANRHVP